jgi:hypothetical protein
MLGDIISAGLAFVGLAALIVAAIVGAGGIVTALVFLGAIV